MIDKRVRNLAEAVAGVKDGATVLCGGFGASGQPDHLIEALIEQGAKDLVIVSNNAGAGERGLAALLKAGRVRKVICSYPRSAGADVFEALWSQGKLELELVPQGTLSERMRAAGAGIGGFFTPTAAGTKLAHGKETREIDGRRYVLEQPLKGDVALIRGEAGDRWGNLVYRLAAQNFNPVMAMAATLTVAEVRRTVELGALAPDRIHTPGIFVDRVVEVGDPL